MVGCKTTEQAARPNRAETTQATVKKTAVKPDSTYPDVKALVDKMILDTNDCAKAIDESKKCEHKDVK